MLTAPEPELYGILITRLAEEGPVSWVVDRGDAKGTHGLVIGAMLPVPLATSQRRSLGVSISPPPPRLQVGKDGELGPPRFSVEPRIPSVAKTGVMMGKGSGAAGIRGQGGDREAKPHASHWERAVSVDQWGTRVGP